MYGKRTQHSFKDRSNRRKKAVVSFYGELDLTSVLNFYEQKGKKHDK